MSATRPALRHAAASVQARPRLGCYASAVLLALAIAVLALVSPTPAIAAGAVGQQTATAAAV